MPFVKGQSGSPAGRSKADLSIRDAARLHGEAAIAKLVEFLGCDDRRVALAAAQALLDRGFGKPAQSIELTGDADNPVHLVGKFKLAPLE